jgi:hypothetical protein
MNPKYEYKFVPMEYKTLGQAHSKKITKPLSRSMGAKAGDL